MEFENPELEYINGKLDRLLIMFKELEDSVFAWANQDKKEAEA